jgi:hypothetical protein
MSYCHPRHAMNSAYAASGPGGPGAGFDHPFARPGFGPPFALKALAVVGAVALCPPLGIAALAYLAWRGLSHGGGPGWRRFAEGGAGWRGRSSGNTALDERRAEVLKGLAEEAEGYAEFERRKREACDREAFDRFMAERAAKPQDGGDKPAGEPGSPAA